MVARWDAQARNLLRRRILRPGVFVDQAARRVARADRDRPRLSRPLSCGCPQTQHGQARLCGVCHADCGQARDVCGRGGRALGAVGGLPLSVVLGRSGMRRLVPADMADETCGTAAPRRRQHSSLICRGRRSDADHWLAAQPQRQLAPPALSRPSQQSIPVRSKPARGGARLASPQRSNRRGGG
jgi:hypothetical protein